MKKVLKEQQSGGSVGGTGSGAEQKYEAEAKKIIMDHINIMW